MTPLFDGGNVNRSGKKIYVTVENPAGKYQLFSRNEHGDKALYLLTASGRIDRTSEYFQTQWDEKQRKWVDARPTEAHNAPVQKLLEAKEKLREEEAERKRQDELRQKQEKLNSRIDEIAKAIEKKELIGVKYKENEFDGKNPVLELFKIYDISMPLRTQGWVNGRLAGITDRGYYYFSKKGKVDSTSFMGHLNKLREAIRLMPIELQRQSSTVDADKEVKTPMEKQVYEKFSELFPNVISGEYNYLKLEAGSAMMPLSIEWIGTNRISVMHTYKLNGDLCYDPMMVFDIRPKEYPLIYREIPGIAVEIFNVEKGFPISLQGGAPCF